MIVLIILCLLDWTRKENGSRGSVSRSRRWWKLNQSQEFFLHLLLTSSSSIFFVFLHLSSSSPFVVCLLLFRFHSIPRHPPSSLISSYFPTFFMLLVFLSVFSLLLDSIKEIEDKMQVSLSFDSPETTTEMKNMRKWEGNSIRLLCVILLRCTCIFSLFLR